MIILTIIMSIIVLVLMPINIGIDLYTDLDNKCVVVLMSIYGVVFFDSMIDTDGTNINYKGSINGSVAIVDIDFVDIDDILRAMQYRSIRCRIGTDISNCKYMYMLSFVLAVFSIATPIINETTDTNMSTTCDMCGNNYMNVSMKLSSTPLAVAGALVG